MSPKKAGRVTDHARGLMAQGVITRNSWVVFDNLMWGAGRLPFVDQVITTYSNIQAATRLRRQCVSDAIKQLVAAGLIQKFKRHTTVEWRQGRKFVQLANRYRVLLAPRCESGGRTRCREALLYTKKSLTGLVERFGPRPQEPVRTVEEQLAIIRRWAAEDAATKQGCSGG